MVGGNDDVQVIGNLITGSTTPGPGFQGIIVVAPQRTGQPPTAGLVVAGNRVRGFRTPAGTGNGIVIGIGSTTGARVVGNDVRDNQVAGVSIGAGSTDNLVVGNRLEDNTTVGLRVTGTGNRLIGNTLLGNGTDAEDLSDPDPEDGVQLLNTWLGNRCETDRPAGAIC